MGRGLGQVTGLLAFGLVVARLGRLLETGPGEAEWRVVLVSSALLGGVTWWLVVRMFANPRLGLAVFAASALILFLRVSVPGTLVAGFLPGPDTPGGLLVEMTNTMDVIRHGLPPVEAVDGLVAVLAFLSFLIGASFAWGAVGGGPISAAVVPSFVLYLQLGVLDTSTAGLGWMLASAGVLCLGTASISMDRKSDTGSTRDGSGAVLPRRSAPLALATSAVVAVIALVLANVGSALAPERSLASGGGDLIRGLFGGGAGSFDRWVDLRQRLLSPTGAVMFTATFDDPTLQERPIYWRMETLDDFNGISWSRTDSTARPYAEGTTITDLSTSYAGTVVTATQDVRIAGLRTGAGIVPAAGSPVELRAIGPLPGVLEPSEFTILPDGAVAYPPGLSQGHTYRLISQFPDLEADMGAMATGPDGVLTPLFAAAFEAGGWNHPPLVLPRVAAPTDLGRYQSLPPGLPPSLLRLAREVTAGASTDFERAWMLQSWFRDSGSFTYSTEVTTGHRALDLAAWLADPTSRNHRTGYCEQFAASMAVLARTLGMGSRVVWGFAPGRVVNGEVVVRDLNAHAWVELWIEGFGWVPFEPTPRSEILPRSLTSEFDTAAIAATLVTAPTPEQPPDTPPPPPPDRGADGPGWRATPLWTAGIAVFVLLSVAPLAKLVRRSRRKRRLSEGEVSAAWDEIVDRLSDLGATISPAWTPLELAEEMDAGLVGVAARYSAELYGGEEGLGRLSDLEEVEKRFKAAYGPGRRAVATLNPRSLIRNR